ncbi:MAG: DUF1858 domain-containing protein [Leptospiraceae bacterium]|nr:DUF1858 domain-containing protein [Leptospiraceae bacterium]MCK6381227.1 DUF1858 domain-containing protein [Leptospiraceae bacterium]NUM40750.1 DUF1858 domain-containing protein [Leptospiraceae bacterium]
MTSATAPKFHKNMTIGEAIALHPDTALVLSSYHLGGCSSCSISEFETIEQACIGYGVEINNLIDSLNNLLDAE